MQYDYDVYYYIVDGMDNKLFEFGGVDRLAVGRIWAVSKKQIVWIMDSNLSIACQATFSLSG